ncbi:MAG: zinc ribbon domain-containing protein [Actinobacteria bacterium]|nr:zinc ribbon domain-containing protein [Actinomycetota bacterium]MCG2818972.1 zinc ribbon domain-containing protein [Actinomycetes bacterium]MBU4219533.1 zinc ribbon domain-containing protein [Actinomycetota bacterium]MBU4359107.1 zinc ribbon domain-containing protein [Actinomycetota bacterium]MBU4392452.1 zinc ribbon domain-containing protein [Actinomycetota bacterium]
MKCSRCGSDNAGAMKFCTNCGAPLGDPTIPMDRVPPPGKPPSTTPEPTRAFAQPPIPPAVAPAPAPAATGGGMKKSTIIIICVVVALLAVVGAAAGFVYWRVIESNKLIAEIESVELVRADGETLDLKDVPLDVDLVLKVTYRSHFKEDGEASLEVIVVDGNGEETLNDSFKPRSSNDLQEYEYDFYMTLSEGETFKATADLDISRGDKKVTDRKSLEFYVEEGEGEELKLENVKEAASGKIEEARSAVSQAAAEGIETADLTQLLDTIESDLESATTEKEASDAFAGAEAVINECNVRRAAVADEAARQQDIAAARKVMFDYAYAERGNCEDVWWVEFSMNNERTGATGKLEGMVTAHTDPDRAGQITYFFLTAEKRGGQWVVTDYSYEHIF